MEIPLYRTDLKELLLDSKDKIVYLNQTEEKTAMGTFIIGTLCVNTENGISVLRMTTEEPYSGVANLTAQRTLRAKQLETMTNELKGYGFDVQSGSSYLACKVSFDKFFKNGELIPLEIAKPDSLEKTEKGENPDVSTTNKGKAKK